MRKGKGNHHHHLKIKVFQTFKLQRVRGKNINKNLSKQKGVNDETSRRLLNQSLDNALSPLRSASSSINSNQSIEHFCFKTARLPDKMQSVENQTQNSRDTTLESSQELKGPDIMDVRMGMEMFGTLKKEFSSLKDELKKDIDELKKKENIPITDALREKCKEEALDCFSDKIAEDRKKVLKLELQLEESRRQNKTLTQCLERFTVQMDDVTSRLDNLELNKSKYSVMLTGLYTSEKKWEAAPQVADFIDQVLQVQPEIDEVYHLGGKDPKPIVITFPTLKDRRLVMRNKAVLKDVRNEDGKKFFLQDYNPPQIAEKRKREREIISDNKKLDKNSQLKIDRVKGGIKIQNKIYKKKVLPPTPKELSEIELDQYDAMMKAKMNQGETITQEASKFIAFNKPTNTHFEIRQLYKRMRLTHPAARHIVCVYWIDGAEPHYCKDFCDDDEPGAGRYILQWMIENDLKCRVFFIVRYYGGIKIGGDRFKCYVEAACKSMEGGDFNYHLNKHQEVQHQQLLPKSVDLSTEMETTENVGKGKILYSTQAKKMNSYRGNGRGQNHYQKRDLHPKDYQGNRSNPYKMPNKEFLVYKTGNKGMNPQLVKENSEAPHDEGFAFSKPHYQQGDLD